MTWVWVVVIVVVIGALSVVLVSRGETMAEVYDDRPDSTIPVGRPLTADDLRDIRFSTAVRGYRMDEVDALLSRLRADLLARDDRDERDRDDRDRADLLARDDRDDRDDIDRNDGPLPPA
ncbi:MAG: DivIVA domain-containing protein [Nocardioidaceae bacterium]|nr:DivIVA domain-containing protein [Nocardioidaceae bacterium]